MSKLVQLKDNDGNVFPKTYNIYKTSEVKTDKVWIDNKTIYRKVIQTTSPSSANTWSVIGSIPNMNAIINMYGFLRAKNGRLLPINHTEPSYQVSTTMAGSNIEMRLSNSAWASSEVCLTCEYTKK